MRQRRLLHPALPAEARRSAGARGLRRGGELPHLPRARGHVRVLPRQAPGRPRGVHPEAHPRPPSRRRDEGQVVRLQHGHAPPQGCFGVGSLIPFD